jgi:uncharacterized protein (DUF1501 family)
MPEINRRKFLIASAGGAVALSAAAAISWPELMRAAGERPLADGSGILVLVTLYGGNDGINTLIPYADPAYHDARPDLAYSPAEALHLDDRLGLNPGMTQLAGLWRQQQLAIVRGVGYPNPDHSHFRSMDIWQTASPTEPVATGWIGRWLDATGDDPLRAVNIGAVLPPLAVGAKTTAAALSVGSRRQPQGFQSAVAALGKDDPNDTAAMSAVAESYRATATTDAQLGPLSTPSQTGADAGSADTGGRRGSNSLSAELELVSRCISAGVPTRVYSVQLGGFDTHADERGTQQRLLTSLDGAIGSFLTRMANDRYGKNVVVAAYSEFGRRVAANGSQGTDHGTAGPVLVAGPRVRGGFYGDEPSLRDLNNGDLKVTTDFRDVYQELLSRGIGADPVPAVGGGRNDVGFL